MSEIWKEPRLERVAMQLMYYNEAIRTVGAAREEARELLRIADGLQTPDARAADLWHRMIAHDPEPSGPGMDPNPETGDAI